MSRKQRVEPSVVWTGRKGEPWDDRYFWNCGVPKCQEWIITPNIGVAPRGRGQARTEVRAEADLAQHMAEFHPVRKRPAVLTNAYRWMDATWRCVRAVAHWYLTSPVPPALGLLGLLGLLVLAVIGEAGL